MSWSLFSESGAPLALQPALPAAYRGEQLPGATVWGSAEDSGLVVVQEWRSALCALRLSWFEFRDRTTLVGKLLSPNLQARIQRRGTLSSRVQGLGTLSLRQNQYALFGVPPTECRTTFGAATACQFLDVVYGAPLLSELAPHVPRLQKALDTYAAGKAVALTRPHTWATGAMLDLVEEFLASPFTPGLREVYLECKVRELLLLQVHEAYGRIPVAEGPFSATDRAAAYGIRTLILENPEVHYTIGELARRFAINEHKLKSVFKSIFGVGPFECLLQARMNRARDLLLETDLPIKAIASMTGYQYQTSFITAFRKHFGYTPASLRRKE